MAVMQPMKIDTAYQIDERVIVALERIAAAVEVLAQNLALTAPEPAPVCAHPFDQIVFIGTNSEPAWRCGVCEAAVTEADYTTRARGRR